MTRDRILEALIQLLAEGRLHDFTIRDVAERAGVSYASVYRHYSTREALLRALHGWVEKRPSLPPMPESLEELPSWIKGLIAGLEGEGAEGALAASAALSALNIHPEGTRRRDEQMQRMVAEVAPRVQPAKVRQVSAVLRHLSNSAAWRTMRVSFGLSGEEAAEALSWALGVLIREIKERGMEEERQ